MTRNQRILLVGETAMALGEALTSAGYRIDSLLSCTADRPETSEAYDLVIVDVGQFSAIASDERERFAFLCGDAAVAVLLDSPDLPAPFDSDDLVTRHIDVLYTAEAASGLLPARIDRILFTGRINKWFVSAQGSIRRERHLEQEISLREHVLRRQQVLNWEILSALDVGVLIVDPAGDIVFVNAAAAAFCSRGDLFGSRHDEVLPEELSALISGILSEKGGKPHDSHNRLRFGGRHVSSQVCVLRDQPDEFRGLLLFLHDETEDVRREQQLVTAEKLATLGTTLSGIAHELRNPLSIIASQAVLARRHISEPERLDPLLESMEQQTERCAFIVNSLLDLARSRPSVPGYHSLAEIAADALRYLAFRPDARHVTIENTISPDYRIFADRQRTVQILLNLLSNALDAAGPGGTVKVGAQKEGASHVVLSIEDTGPGIAAEHAGRIFDPFFSTKDPGKGTGLGLTLTSRMVDDCGGALWFDSKPGKTVFYAALPAERGAGAWRRSV